MPNTPPLSRRSSPNSLNQSSNAAKVASGPKNDIEDKKMESPEIERRHSDSFGKAPQPGNLFANPPQAPLNANNLPANAQAPAQQQLAPGNDKVSQVAPALDVNRIRMDQPAQLDAASLNDFRIAHPGQRFFGGLRPSTGEIVLVASEELVGNVSESDFQRSPVLGRHGQHVGNHAVMGAGHLNAMLNSGVWGPNVKTLKQDIVAFSVRKQDGGMPEMTWASGLNDMSFGNQVDRQVPEAWQQPITNAFLALDPKVTRGPKGDCSIM